MEENKVNRSRKLLDIARMLRRNMTRHEKRLWYDFLQRFPVKVYKQRIIDEYVVDFYCHSARLAIELDGSQHYTEEGKAYDAARSAVLEQNGIFVLRFLNRELDENFYGVCATIEKIIMERMGK